MNGVSGSRYLRMAAIIACIAAMDILARSNRAFVGDSSWNESDHPRDKDGKFGKGGASSGNQPQDISGLLGTEYTGVKGQDAINKLMQEKRGHVKGAFTREDIGDIDLVWGDDTFGLQHVVKRREEQGIDVTSFLSGLSDVIEKGEIRKINERGNFEISYDGNVAVVSPELRGNKLTFLLTAFRTRK